jgi:hypothetical protein
MPHKSQRQSRALNASKQRWSGETYASSDDSSFSIDSSNEDEAGANYLNFKDKIQICDVADILEFCKNQCNIRYLSVLVYWPFHDPESVQITTRCKFTIGFRPLGIASNYHLFN